MSTPTTSISLSAVRRTAAPAANSSILLTIGKDSLSSDNLEVDIFAFAELDLFSLSYQCGF
jgi:hypothetical protein